jgi:formiminotetrahydrofolate cyclodeaminase
MANQKINYTNRDFQGIRQDLINYTKQYYPDLVQNFNDASVFSVLMDLNAAVADNLHFHIDRSIQETVLQYAQQRSSIYNIARTYGLKIPGYRPSVAVVDVSIVVPPLGDSEDYRYLGILRAGSQFNGGGNTFETVYDIDFSTQYNQEGFVNRTKIPTFDANNKIIEYKLRDASKEKLIGMNLRSFANETASESPAPGGGSISAYVGSLGASLGTMVANLSAGKRGWEDQVSYFSDWADKGQIIKDKLLKAVDEDTHAFNQIMLGFGLPKATEEEKVVRVLAIENATKYACQVPFKVMETAFETLELLAAMIEKGNQNSITDAGVGVLCVKTAVRGAYFNVLVNAKELKDRTYAEELIGNAKNLLAKNHIEADALIAKVEAALV